MEVTIVRSRHQEWETVSILVPAIWLAFYALAIVGALTGPPLVTETRGITTAAEIPPALNERRSAWK